MSFRIFSRSLWFLVIALLFLASCTSAEDSIFQQATAQAEATANELYVSPLTPVLVPTSVPTESSTSIPAPQKNTPVPNATKVSVEEPALEVAVATTESGGGAFSVGSGGEEEGTAVATFAPLTSGQFTLVSASSGGEQGNRNSWSSAISNNGQVIAFVSRARNFSNSRTESVYVHDLQTGQTEIISTTSEGIPVGGFSPAISADGRYVVFLTDDGEHLTDEPTNRISTFVHDRETGEIALVSIIQNPEGRGGLDGCPSISADGQFVVFHSAAGNLMARSDINPGNWDGTTNIFIHNRITKETQLVSVSPDNEPGKADSECPVVSADGRYVAFHSQATNLTNSGDARFNSVFIRDLETQQTIHISQVPADPRYEENTFVFNQYPSISADGRYTVYASTAIWLDERNDTHWFAKINIYDIQTGETQQVEVGDDITIEPQIDTLHPVISADGSTVAFWVGAEKRGSLTITREYEQFSLYLANRETGEVQAVPLPSYGEESITIRIPNVQPSPALSVDGSFLAFTSLRTDIVPEQTSSYFDIFVYEVP